MLPALPVIERHECSLCGKNLELEPFTMDHTCIAGGAAEVIVREYVPVDAVLAFLEQGSNSRPLIVRNFKREVASRVPS